MKHIIPLLLFCLALGACGTVKTDQAMRDDYAAFMADHQAKQAKAIGIHNQIVADNKRTLASTPDRKMHKLTEVEADELLDRTMDTTINSLSRGLE